MHPGCIAILAYPRRVCHGSCVSRKAKRSKNTELYAISNMEDTGLGYIPIADEAVYDSAKHAGRITESHIMARPWVISR